MWGWIVAGILFLLWIFNVMTLTKWVNKYNELMIDSLKDQYELKAKIDKLEARR